MSEKFTTTLLQQEGMQATGISVPPEVVAALGTKKRLPVKVTLNGYTYQSTIASYGDVFMLPVAKEHRDAAGLKAGDEIEVILELDETLRTVEVPADLAAALDKQSGLRASFDALAYSKRKEFVRQVESAKTEETRTRRIEKVITTLTTD